MMSIDDALERAERLESERVRAAVAHDAHLARCRKWLRFWKWLAETIERLQYVAIGAAISNGWWLVLAGALAILGLWMAFPVSRWEVLVSDAEKRGERMRSR